MVHVLGTVTLKTLHGAISVLRTGRYVGLCVENNCDWETPETDSINETDEQLLRHHYQEHQGGMHV